jgi:hypothetical protein
MYRLTILTLFSAFALTSIAQDFCGTEHDPKSIQPYMYGFAKNRSFGSKEIDCVVHIVYTDSLPYSYFDEAYVENAIDLLNDDFFVTNISFNLVDITYTDLTDYSWHDSFVHGNVCFPTYGNQNTQLANDIRGNAWDLDSYMNIYVVPDMCTGILGWSYITNYVYNKRDGVWINAKAFGVGADHLPSRNNENKVLTHEVGHYCGLLHVFQGTTYCGQNADQNDEFWYMYGDLVADTPPIDPSWTCGAGACPPSWNSTRPWADYEHNNHMDYYPDSCRQIFTEGQIERMHTMLEFQRASLFGGEQFCFGDLTGDGVVGILDLMEVIQFYGQHSNEGDLDNNGIVNNLDVQLLLIRWGTECNDPDAAQYVPTSPPSSVNISQLLDWLSLHKQERTQ